MIETRFSSFFRNSELFRYDSLLNLTEGESLNQWMNVNQCFEFCFSVIQRFDWESVSEIHSDFQWFSISVWKHGLEANIKEYEIFPPAQAVYCLSETAQLNESERIS